jgi:hypothetical protein
LCPWLGGVEALPGVFGGRFSRSRSAAFSAISASTRANSVPISASFSEDDSEEKSGGGTIESSNHDPSPLSTSCGPQAPSYYHSQLPLVSNYDARAYCEPELLPFAAFESRDFEIEVKPNILLGRLL